MCVIYVTAQESIHRELLLYTKCLARCLWKCCSWMKKISVCFVLFFHQNICNLVVTDSHIIRNLIFPYLKDEDLFGSSVVSFLLAWTGAHRGARSSAFPIESILPWWSMARCSPIPPGEEIQHILRFKLPSQSNMQIAYIFLVVLLTTDSTHLVIVPICDSIGLNSSLLHLKQHPHSQDWLAVLSTQLQQHTVTNLGEKNTLTLKMCSVVFSESYRQICIVFLSRAVSYLIWSLQLFVLHFPQHIISRTQRSHLGVAVANKSWQADKPQAVAVAKQTLGPHLRHRWICFGHPLSWFDLLRWKRSDVNVIHCLLTTRFAFWIHIHILTHDYGE